MHARLFRSFWMGGYEGADHVNSHGVPLDLRRSNGHLARLDEDYAALYRRYEALAERTPGVTFTGRLGTYRYYNMDQVVAQSLALFARMAQESSVAA